MAVSAYTKSGAFAEATKNQILLRAQVRFLKMNFPQSRNYPTWAHGYGTARPPTRRPHGPYCIHIHIIYRCIHIHSHLGSSACSDVTYAPATSSSAALRCHTMSYMVNNWS